MGDLAEGALGFIDRCARASAAAASTDFLTTLDAMGFEAVACGAWAGVGKNRRHRFFFVKWPQDWLDVYNKNGWFDLDPLPEEARRRVSPFVLSEMEHGKFSDAQREFYNAAWDYGWRDAFAVPIHGPGSLQGLVTMATKREGLRLDTRSRAALEAMARAIWERCRGSEGFGVSAPAIPMLSSREIECLQWAAAGKTDGDIAAILGIKPATAHFHIERAKKKFGVKTRVEAVAVGVLHGII